MASRAFHVKTLNNSISLYTFPHNGQLGIIFKLNGIHIDCCQELQCLRRLMNDESGMRFSLPSSPLIMYDR